MEAYHLTRLRLAAGLWLLLVFFGFITLALWVYLEKETDWLVKRNSFVATLLLFVAAVTPVDSLIASYNVAHCLRSRERSTPSLDVIYVSQLGIGALAAAQAYDEHTGSKYFGEIIKYKWQPEVDFRSAQWRSWNLEPHLATWIHSWFVTERETK